MKNIKLLSVMLSSIIISLYSSCAHATDNAQPKEPQKTVRIVIEQSYRDGTSPVEGVNLPFESIAQRLLEYANLIVVVPETKDSDYTLKIQATGEALGGNYSQFGGIGGQYYYTGASLNGTITLEFAGASLHNASFSGKISPPNQISPKLESTSPSRAPFYGAFESSNFESELVRILGEVYGLQFLLNALKDTDIRETVIQTLGESKDPRAIDSLITALKDGDVDVRIDAGRALEKIGTAAVEPLIAALNIENADVRKTVIQTLGEIKDRRAVDPLITALKDENAVVRERVVKALKEIKDPRTIDPLITALKDENAVVRERVAETLEEMGMVTVEPLITALKNPESRTTIVEILQKITGQSIGEDDEAWLKWWQEHKE